MKHNLPKLLLAVAVLALLFALSVPALAATDVCPSSNDGKHDWKYFNFADCTSGGSAYYQCTKCHAVKDEKWVDALGHSWSEWNVRKAATCTENGTSYHTCSRCKKSETKTVKATGHSYEWKITKRVTCGTAGSRQQVCKVCGAKGKTETIKATGQHTYEWKVTKKATCGEAGSRQQVCKVCGAKGRAEKIAATGKHTFGAWTGSKAASCEEAGQEKHVCSVCGKTETRSIDALGHDWDEGVVTKKPDNLDPGVKTYTCKRDPSHTRTEEIPAKNGDSEPSQETEFVIVSQHPAGGEMTIAYASLNMVRLRIETKGGIGAITYSLSLTSGGEEYPELTTTKPAYSDRDWIEFETPFPGVYVVHATDEAGRTVDSQPVTLSLLPLEVSISRNSGAETPEVNMIILAGMPPYDCVLTRDGETVYAFTLDDVESSFVRRKYPAAVPGEYALTVTDSAGDVKSASVVIDAVEETDTPAPLTIVSQPDDGMIYAVSDSYSYLDCLQDPPQYVEHTGPASFEYYTARISVANGVGKIRYELFDTATGESVAAVTNESDQDGISGAAFPIQYSGIFYIHVSDDAGRTLDSREFAVGELWMD